MRCGFRPPAITRLVKGPVRKVLRRSTSNTSVLGDESLIYFAQVAPPNPAPITMTRVGGEADDIRGTTDAANPADSMRRTRSMRAVMDASSKLRVASRDRRCRHR